LADSCLTSHLDLEPTQIQLPPEHEALHFSRVYFEYIGYFQNIIYRPHMLELIDGVYHRASQGPTATAPQGLALILAVIAMAVVLEPIEGSLTTVLPILKERLDISVVYIRASMDCLQQHCQRMNHSLESVQAMLVLHFLINHIETNSPRAATLLAEAVTAAQCLGLHLVDSVSRAGSLGSPARVGDPLIQEMKRRVWWYLTATDWMMSLVEGESLIHS
jgi:alkylhydroperoxidase family enzyme